MSTYWDVLCFCVQDTILVVPPYPLCNEDDRHDVPLEGCWYARRPPLFFTCVLRPKDGRLPKNLQNRPWWHSIHPGFLEYLWRAQIAYQGAYGGRWSDQAVWTIPNPCLYVANVQNMVGRVPLMPLFLAGNLTPTIPHIFSKHKDSRFPYGCADTAATDRRRGSNVYEVNPWLWQFGRGKPRLGGLTIEETSESKDAVSNAQHKCAAATVRHRKATPAWFEVHCVVW